MAGSEARVVGVLGDALGADILVDYALLRHTFEERLAGVMVHGVFEH